MAFEKLYNEIYAVVALKYFWEPYQSGFVKGESPDWYHDGLDFGMEVTQALQSKDGAAESFLERFLGCLEEEIPALYREKYAGELYFYNGRLWAILPDGEDEMAYFDKALYRFSRKLAKLNDKYRRFSLNGLYLYLHTKQETASIIQELFTQMALVQKDAAVKFDLVFLDCEDTLYVLNFPTHTVQTIELPEKALRFMEEETELLRHRSCWKNGTVVDDVLQASAWQ